MQQIQSLPHVLFAHLTYCGLNSGVEAGATVATCKVASAGATDAQTVYGRIPSGQNIPPLLMPTPLLINHTHVMNRFLLSGLITGFILFGLCATPEIHADGGFQISPIRLSLSQQGPIAVMTVRNHSATSRAMQLETMQWKQREGEDLYESTREILASPPIFTIPSGETQIVRVGLRREPAHTEELSYRLFLREIPMDTVFKGEVKITMRFGIPVFVTPTQIPAEPQLNWRIRAASQNNLMVEAINDGNAHIQITHFVITNSANNSLLTEQHNMQYLLPKQQHQWLIAVDPMPQPDSRLTITGETDSGAIDAEVVMERQ